MNWNERHRRREAFKATIRRSMFEQAGRIANSQPEHAKWLAALADRIAEGVIDGMLREWQVREKPRGGRVVPE